MKIKNQPPKSQNGFTLIELLVVISIISILGAVATPGLMAALRKAEQNKAMQDARQIGIGLRNYATDYDGAFPAGETNDGEEISSSNDAFRVLFPNYMDTERVFAVTRSAYGKRADNRFDEQDDILKAGENHFAYVAGLNDTARSDWPLVVDGTDGNGTYSSMRGEKGGAWEGTRGIVITVGGSARVVPLKGEDDARYLPREGYPEENMLKLEAYMGKGVELLEPEEG